MSTVQCHRCHGHGHMSYQCPTKSTQGSPNQPSAPAPSLCGRTGQWDSGKPKIWCPSHEAWGAHEPQDCRKRSRAPPGNGTLSMTPPPPPSGSPPPPTWHMDIRELIAECMPESANRFRLLNCPHGIKHTFPRDTTKIDMDWVRANVTGLTRVYQEGRVLVFGLADADSQRATFDRFKTLRDGDKPITVEYIGDAPSAVISGLNLQPTGLTLAPAPTTPSKPPASPQLSDSPSVPGDVPMTDTPDAAEARFQAIEGNIQALNGKVDGLGMPHG